MRKGGVCLYLQFYNRGGFSMPTENRDRHTATATTRIALSGMMAALIFVATYFV